MTYLCSKNKQIHRSALLEALQSPMFSRVTKEAKGGFIFHRQKPSGSMLWDMVVCQFLSCGAFSM
jgi:hypothetical protein